MIPSLLKELVERQKGDVRRHNQQLARKAIADLGVPPDSQFAEFFRTYRITVYESPVSDEQLCELEPVNEILAATRFVHSVWLIPDEYVCLTTTEGEGGYFLNKVSGKVWDFTLQRRDEFDSGKQEPRWHGFFDFMIWYLGG